MDASAPAADWGRNGAPLRSAVRKARRRLLPFLLLMYVLAFLDRTNIGFARQAFQMSAGLSDASYGLGAGLFFLVYALLEVPSNLIMHRVGARVWMARIMVTWGLVSAAMIFVSGPASFYGLRVLLGAAEAGFFPGVILYLTYWFPQAQRGQALGVFYFGAPLAFIFGGPLSGLLLRLHGAGLQGWQWMFLIEGVLAAAVGVLAWRRLDPGPRGAAWLTSAEQQALAGALETDDAARADHAPGEVLRALRDPRVLLFTGIYFLIQMSVYGVVFFLPAQVAALLGTRIGLTVGLVTSIPWLCALAATWIVPRLADRSRAHAAWAIAALLAAAAGIAVSAFAGPALGVLALCCAAAGFISVQPVFWTFPTARLSGVAAAGGIAAINAVGSLGGFVAPVVKTWADHALGSGRAGLCLLAATTCLAALLFLPLLRRRSIHQAMPSDASEA